MEQAPVYLDLETRSVLSVKDVGVDAMTAAPGMILSGHYAIGDAPVRHWRGAFADGASPMAFDPDPQRLLDAIRAGADVWAHNARFDRTVWNAWAPAHWPRLTIEQTLDSATLCRLANLPAALGQVVGQLGGVKLENKHYRRLWSAEQNMGPDCAALYAEMIRYGDGDVVAMRDHVIKLLPALDDRTREEWLASERVNDRGFAIDTAWAAWAAEAFARCAQTEGAEISALTSGLVPTPKSTAAALVWAEMHLGRSITRAAKQRVGGGRAGFRTVTKASLDKAARRELRAWLLESDDAPPITGSTVLEFIDRLDLASDTAGTKYAAAGKRVSPDGRLRGSYIFHGASQTGRFSAGGLQPHNLIRHKAKNVAAERAAVAEAPTMKGIGKMLRSTIVADGPGKRLAWRDWSAIEARITPWLALGPDTPPAERESAEAVLDVFHTGGDIYLQAASGIYKREVTKADAEQRQVGKVCVLSLGFAGGVGALVAMSRGYNVVVPEPKVIVAAYREANPWIVWFCRAVERAASRAVRAPGETFTAGRLSLVSTGAELLMVLPDGHPLVYPRPRIEMVDRFGSGEEDPTVTFDHPAFGRAALSGPVCSENPTQAVAARLLRRALVFHDREVAADPHVGPIVMHTHDEMVAECETENLGLTASALERSMSTLEPWAEGLPIASEGGSGTYYQTEQED